MWNMPREKPQQTPFYDKTFLDDESDDAIEWIKEDSRKSREMK